MQRRLAAILAADVVGYSRMIRADEESTLAALRKLRDDSINPKFKQYRGRVVKLMGDGILAEFASVVDAVACGAELQQELRKQNEGLDETEQIVFRIGINLGDVVVDDDDIQGDGVNVAARLEALAEPGGICISSAVYDQVRDRLDLQFDNLGHQDLKNIDRPIEVWRWSGSNAKQAPSIDVKKAPLSLPDKPSIAILPFDNMSGDPEQDYFADGVVEALTAALSCIRSFFVIARNSAFAYKGQPLKISDIRRELGVAYVLEGSVQRAAARVRITVQLIDTERDVHIWAEKYDGSLDDIFDLQDRITEQVAGALQPSIRLAEIERVQRKRPQDLGAYDYTMQAFRHVWMLEKEEAGKGLTLLTKALQIDPGYPLALALAAWCHAQSSVYNWVEDIAAAKALSLAKAEKAAELSADDPLILTVLGTVHTFSRNFGAARVLLERAVALDANAAWAWSRLGWLAVYTDKSQDALTYFEKAIRLSPIDPMNFNNHVGIASAHQAAGDDDKAADMFFRALAERSNAHWIHRNLAPALWGAGRKHEARDSYNRMLDWYPDLTVKRYKEAMVFSGKVLDRIGDQLIELGLPEA